MSDLAVATTPEVSAGSDAMSADLDTLDSGVEETSATEEADGGEPGGDEDLTPEPAEEAPEAVDEEPAPVEEEQPEPVAAKPEEELPEGVRVRVRENGKKEYVLREARYHAVYGGFEAARAAEQVFGEVLTPELCESRQQAFLNQEMMIGDFMSGDPAAEGRFLNQMLEWSRQAQENGEVQHSPIRNIASRLPHILAQTGDYEALDAIAAPVIRMRLDALYNEAAGAGKEDLFLSLQHIDNALFGSYKKREQLGAPDALSAREAALAERENRLREQDTQRMRGEYRRWEDATSTGIRDTVANAISETLKPVEAAYKNFPIDFQGAKDLIRADFHQAMKKDQAWQQYLISAQRRAANAKSPEVRQAVADDLKARYEAKLRHWVDPTRNPKVKEILSQRAAAMKAQSDAQHRRLQNGATRREPGTIGTPVRQTVTDTPNGGSTADSWAEAVGRI